MLRIFSVILGISFTGSVLLLLFLLLSPLLRRCFSAVWYRTALCVLLSFFAVPAGMLVRSIMEVFFTSQAMISLPFMGEVPEPLANVIFAQATKEPAVTSWMLENLLMLFAVLWLGIAAILLMRKMLSLMRFRRELRHSICPVEDDWMLIIHRQVLRGLGIQKHIRLCQSPYTSTPMIVGLANATVILPDIGWSQEELALVLRHELTHYRNRDLWVKWVGTMLCVLHWFNPCIWLLVRQLERWMELACDASVVCNMDLEQRRVYGNTILLVLGRAQPEYGQGVCAAFCEDKKNMKERLTAMINVKKSTKKVGILSVFVLVLLCITGMLMGAAAHTPETEAISETQNIFSEEGTPDAAPSNVQDDPTDENALDAGLPAPLEEGIAEDTIIDFLWPVDGGAIILGLDGYPGHSGIDIPRPQDTEIYASAAGIVTLAEDTMTGYGKYLVIDHGGGYQTLYSQCNALLVEVGDEVEAGQIVAKVGRSGHATGNHLHFELRYNGDILDPEQYITLGE